MQQAMARKHHDLLLDFQKAQMGYKDSLQRRQARELEILMPEISEEERQEMLQNGETSSMVLVQKMAGAHASLLDEVNRIRDKHQDILRLEQNIADLAQMFQEMAVLVDAQGEMLDSIEVHVHQVKSATAKAEQNLKQTLKAQHKHRKYMCCLMIIMVIVAISILAPVLVKVTE
jgi:t-SNARE complex subunit (syntaxin)